MRRVQAIFITTTAKNIPIAILQDVMAYIDSNHHRIDDETQTGSMSYSSSETDDTADPAEPALSLSKMTLLLDGNRTRQGLGSNRGAVGAVGTVGASRAVEGIVEPRGGVQVRIGLGVVRIRPGGLRRRRVVRRIRVFAAGIVVAFAIMMDQLRQVDRHCDPKHHKRDSSARLHGKSG